MKTKELAPAFKPVEVTFIIESEEELIGLWHRLNYGYDIFQHNNKIEDYKHRYKDPIWAPKLDLPMLSFSAIDKIVKELGLDHEQNQD